MADHVVRSKPVKFSFINGKSIDNRGNIKVETTGSFKIKVIESWTIMGWGIHRHKNGAVILYHANTIYWFLSMKHLFVSATTDGKIDGSVAAITKFDEEYPDLFSEYLTELS